MDKSSRDDDTGTKLPQDDEDYVGFGRQELLQ
jgi:hypothetical protein